MNSILRGRLSDRFGLFDQAEGRLVEVAQFGLARFVAGELDQVASFKELAQAILLIGRQQVRFTQFIQEFFGGSFGSVKTETLFEIAPDGIGHHDAEFARLGDESQCLLELSARADVSRYYRDRRHLRPAPLPFAPKKKRRNSRNDYRQGDHSPLPGVRQLDRR